MPRQPRFEGDIAYLNKYALCLTNTEFKVLSKFITHAEREYRMGKITLEHGIADHAVKNVMNKIKVAKAI